MKSDTLEFWNEIWSTMGHTFADYDGLLAEYTSGGNAVGPGAVWSRGARSIWDAARAETPYGWPGAVGR